MPTIKLSPWMAITISIGTDSVSICVILTAVYSEIQLFQLLYCVRHFSGDTWNLYDITPNSANMTVSMFDVTQRRTTRKVAISSCAVVPVSGACYPEYHLDNDDENGWHGRSIRHSWLESEFFQLPTFYIYVVHDDERTDYGIRTIVWALAGKIFIYFLFWKGKLEAVPAIVRVTAAKFLFLSSFLTNLMSLLFSAYTIPLRRPGSLKFVDTFSCGFCKILTVERWMTAWNRPQ